MAKIIALTNLTLDGVMQSPAGPDEDPRDGFQHGGWAAPYGAMQEVGDVFANVGSVLFGRRTYENFHAAWADKPGNPFSDYFNNTQKYVASRTLSEPLVWVKSTLLKGDLAQSLRTLKDEQDKDLLIFGSGVLIQSLMGYGLVDKYVLLIHPLVLGSGHHLFTEPGAFAALRLVGSKTTASGVVISTYEPAPSGGSTT
jgi:dihydrofolate reductase